MTRTLLAGLLALLFAALAGTPRAEGVGSGLRDAPAAPDAALAARLFDAAGPVTLRRRDDVPAVWEVAGPAGPLGVIASTWEIAGSVGYSGKPLDVLVAVARGGTIVGAALARHAEPILTLGISSEDIALYVEGFRGVDLKAPAVEAFGPRADLPPLIARATVSTGVIRDAILRTARTVALGRGLVAGVEAGAVDRVSFEEASWQALEAMGALTRTRLAMYEAHAALAASRPPPEAGPGDFIELWVGLVDPPTVGRNLLGQQAFTAAIGALGPGDSAIFIGSRGAFSHRGTAWRRTGWFDRLEVIQGSRTFRLAAQDFLRVDHLAAAGAPDLLERSVFRLRAIDGFDPAAPFRVEVVAAFEDAAGALVSLRVPLDYVLPAALRLAPVDIVEPESLWVDAWREARVEVAALGAMLGVLYFALILQEPLVRRPRLWRGLRFGFLGVTVVWLGWIEGAQLSVVQVAAFLNALLTGFRWETFLIEPMVFTLWGFVALGLLFVGRGIYCGWLCPFGALQELLSAAAQRLGVRQIIVPHVVQERLWAVKYVLFVGIVALSFHSMGDALVLAEVEPFKTAVSMRFSRAWWFVAYVAALLVAGLFIERFFCRYLCPLGAGLAIPAKMKLFDWLHRRPQCGRECRFCETKCTVGAIDPLGRINPNECVLCLRCQVIMHDDTQCVVLKSRAARSARPAR